ncbi:MAG: tetratricopeptide repeat protein, partial [Acidobacteriota bacterium]
GVLHPPRGPRGRPPRARAAPGGGARAAPPRLYTEALAIRRRLLGDDHLNVAFLRADLANLMTERGELDTAAVLFSRVFGPLDRERPPGDAGRAHVESVYGNFLATRGEMAAARVCLEAGYDALLDIRGPDTLPVRDAKLRLEKLESMSP